MPNVVCLDNGNGKLNLKWNKEMSRRMKHTQLDLSW